MNKETSIKKIRIDYEKLKEKLSYEGYSDIDVDRIITIVKKASNLLVAHINRTR